MIDRELFDLWRERAVEDNDLQLELAEVANNSSEITDRFYRNLDFGTGGLRGVIGAGTNRMNIYTVRRATQGFAEYINSISTSTKQPSVAIGYDSRINSEKFAKETAGVFAGNGIRAYIYEKLAPVPMISFAVRELGCSAGIMITASHNPSKYNGYKAYDPDGCQLGLDASRELLKFIDKVDMFDGVKRVEFEDGLSSGMISYIDDSVSDGYYKNVLSQSPNPGVCKNAGLRVIYTPLNGAGNIPVRGVLAKIGVDDVQIVTEQELPDGHFPTAPYPNPEIRESFVLALKYAENSAPDLLLATDPDCDRVGIAVRDGSEYRLMTGNEVGVLLINYILSQRQANGTLPDNPVVIKTIVSTGLAAFVAKDYGCEIWDVLTGFKFIGEQIALLEQKGESERFIFGFEESYGYLAGDYVRDKDAVVASMLICEMAGYYKKQGKTLLHVMEELYTKYDVHLHTQTSFVCEGLQGMQRMSEIMRKLRVCVPKTIAGLAVVGVSDYNKSLSVDLCTGEQTAINLPKSDVVAYCLNGGASVIIRPSGTEPKIKLYINAREQSHQTAKQLNDAIKADMTNFMGC